MDMRSLVGGNVARLRRERGLTQEVVAERSGLTQQYISDLERGLRNPTVITLFYLAQVLAVEPAALITENGEPRPLPGD